MSAVALLEPTAFAALPIRTACPACGGELEHRRTEHHGAFAVCRRFHAHRVAGVLPQLAGGDPHIQLRLGTRVR